MELAIIEAVEAAEAADKQKEAPEVAVPEPEVPSSTR